MATRAEKDAFLAGVSITLVLLAVACLIGSAIDHSTHFPYNVAMSWFFGAANTVLAIIFHRGDAVPRWAFRLLAVIFITMASSPLWY